MPGILLPILCYHHVGAKMEPMGHRGMWVSKSRFEEQIGYLSRAGYQCITLKDALTCLRGGTALRRKSVVLTFDDGYESFLQVAHPILRHFEFSATLFVVVGEVGGVSRWDRGSAAPLMDWSSIRELNRQGFEIGCHSFSHRRMGDLSEAEAIQELRTSRSILAEELGVPVMSFAYPYGAAHGAAARQVEEAGYRLACLTNRGNIHDREDCFHLKRVPVDESTDLRCFQRRLTRSYDYTCRFHRLMQKFGGRRRSAP
jgi:peptidoglycan/xylan/chitin deacetylase (PgdA/CDA1 family)